MPTHANSPSAHRKTIPFCATTEKLRAKFRKEGWRRSEKPSCRECQLKLEIRRLQIIIGRRQELPTPYKSTPSPFNSEGWVRIGRKDRSGRRSLWLRVNDADNDKDEYFYMDEFRGPIELCSGREGNDAYVYIDEGNPLHSQIHNVLTTTLYAIPKGQV